MQAVLISIATLAVVFVMMAYGAYTEYYSFKRTEYVTVVGDAVERQTIEVLNIRDDLEHHPATGDVPVWIFAKDNSSRVTYSYVGKPSYGVLCAQMANSDVALDALSIVQGRIAGSTLGAGCDDPSTPASNVALSVRITDN